MQKPLKSICIVGGGTAGWMAATLLSSLLRGTKTKITLVESPDIATIGVGESTVPSMLDFLQASQVDLKAFMQATSATFKLGIRFDHWANEKSHYFHPFGRVGKDVNGFDFYQAFLKSQADGLATQWLDYSPNAVMAEHERISLRQHQSNNWVLSSFSHALHLDATAVARYLRELCLTRGVERIEATVNQVELDDKGYISACRLDNGASVNSCFYLDCTGFKALLINKALDVGYESWSNYLPCDRAVTLQTKAVESPKPYTIATAQPSGWSWEIPLQHRTGNGYVFASRFCDDETAISTLLKQSKGALLNEPNVIPFMTGKRHKIWHKNCLALGLSAGFLEPLESTAIHLVYKTLVHFIQYFPDCDFDAISEQAFNQAIDRDYLEIRDFIILHYCTAKRVDSDFWRWCQNMPIPDSLQTKLDAFKSRGLLPQLPGQFFSKDSWCSILEGMNMRPDKIHPLMAGFSAKDLANTLLTNISNINATVQQLPNHQVFIQANCPAFGTGVNT